MKFLSRLISRKASDNRGRSFLLSDIPTGSVGCELGVWKGDFSTFIIRDVRPKVLYLIDPWLFQPEFEGSWYGGTVAASQEDMDRIYESVCERFAGEPSVRIIRKKTEELGDEIPDGSLDWAYIDGNHAYEHVLRDLRVFNRKVRDGGILYGDDYGSGRSKPSAVADAVRDFLAETGLRLDWVRKRQFCIRKPDVPRSA